MTPEAKHTFPTLRTLHDIDVRLALHWSVGARL